MRRVLYWALIAAITGSSVSASDNQELVRALSFKPRQADVNYEKVDPSDVAQCKLERISREDGKGFWITGPSGQPLRWFVDTNGDNKPDRWCYFKHGVEVYRESDTDFNGTADEYRWLNIEGTRWGIDSNEDGVVDSWVLISAEEVTSEAIQALANKDAKRFERLLLSQQQLDSLGLGPAMKENIWKRVQNAKEQFPRWMGDQKLVTSGSRWTNFGADKPGLVPAGTEGSSKDVVVYENAVALFEDSGEARQLIIGTMIQIDGGWRLASLPRLVGDQSTMEESGVFFNASFNPKGAGPTTDGQLGMSRIMETLVNELQEIDSKLAAAGGSRELWHGKRADVLEKLVAHSVSAEDRRIWIEQLADTVSAAAQVGEYPNGVRRLREFSTKLKDTDASPNAVAYVAFRTITADHNLKMQIPNAKYDELNESYLNQLREFIQQYPQADDSAEAMLQIALSAEFTGDVKEAMKWYGQASKSFASTDAGKKAAGAVRRMSMTGKPFPIAGPTLDDRSFNSNAYKGGPVVYHLWASWCESCKADMRALKELQAKYARHKLRIVGINLDNDRRTAVEFTKQNPYPWINIHDPGGLESSLAVNYGILTLPVNIVVDKDGNVVKSGVHWTDLDRVIQELIK
jgi:thiol-disulfide isomerase/thioredoxin